MKKMLLVLFVSMFAGAVLLFSGDYRVQKTEKVEKTLHFQQSSEQKDLQVDNIFGSIVVTGYDGKDVKLTAHKTLKARTESHALKAEEEVTLDITEEGDVIDLYVDGPFRKQHNERGQWTDPGYEVHFDFDIKVPRKTNIYLKTATAGNIRVYNIEGKFQIKHADGNIIMHDIAGAGTAKTAAGDVEVHFAKNPESECSFKTVAGDIHAEFLANLSADFLLQARYGDAYSDFPVTLLPAKSSAIEERKNGKYVYRSNASMGVRIGRGGPEIEMDTLAGDILIHKK